jgi:paraquat-inducible protein B
VQLLGIDVGHVNDVHIEYDKTTRSLRTPVTLEVRPDAIPGLIPVGERNPAAAGNDSIGYLVAKGLRARLSSSNLVTGQRQVNLDFVPDAPPARLIMTQGYVEIPSVRSGDLDDLTQSANQTVDNLNRLLNSPEMNRSIRSLDETLANLDQVSRQTKDQIGPLMTSLRKTTEQANVTLANTNRSLGGQTGQGPDLAQAINELTGAARSVRILADYLDQHPEALLRGRTDSHP